MKLFRVFVLNVFFTIYFYSLWLQFIGNRYVLLSLVKIFDLDFPTKKK